MKKHNLLYILLLALLPGCTKVLEKSNFAYVSDEELWSSSELCTAYLNECYSNDLPTFPTTAGDCEEAYSTGSWGTNFMYGQYAVQATAGTTLQDFSLTSYTAIRNLNIFLSDIDGGSLSWTTRAPLKGQAYFLRAWRYWNMVKIYGGVALTLQPLDLVNDYLYLSRSKTSVCIDSICKDLDSAIADLPSQYSASADQGRVTRGAALALKGRILLYYASPQFNPNNDASRWTAAYKANVDAVDTLTLDGYGLYSSYSQLWFNELGSQSSGAIEDIFVTRYSYADAVTTSTNLSLRPASVGGSKSNCPTVEMVDSFPMADGHSIYNSSASYPYDTAKFWENRDPRFYATVVYNNAIYGVGTTGAVSGRHQWTFTGNTDEGSSNTTTGFYCRKAVDTTFTTAQATASGTDWIEIRYAEVLLNLAECANEVGDQATAYSCLEKIRARAGIVAGSDGLYGLQASMTTDQMRTACMHERQIELCYEGQRFWDLRRRRWFSSVLNGTVRHGYTVTVKLPTGYTLSTFTKALDAGTISITDANYTTYFSKYQTALDTYGSLELPDTYYFWPIAADQITKDPNLIQTEGWGTGTFDPLL